MSDFPLANTVFPFLMPHLLGENWTLKGHGILRTVVPELNSYRGYASQYNVKHEIPDRNLKLESRRSFSRKIYVCGNYSQIFSDC